jgi:uroporphyrinogen decarboxylase
MTSRERVRTVLDGGIPDRVPIHDGYWDETLRHWQGQGLPRSAISDYDDSLGEFFGTERILEEDQRYITKVTKNGTVVREIRNHTSTPGLLSFPVGSRKDWHDIKWRLASTEGRLPRHLQTLYESYRNHQRFVVVTVHDPYEASWSKLGPTYLLEAMKTDPDLVREVFATITNLNIAVCEELLGQGYDLDGAWIWGDIAYSRGTLFSPELYREILYPFHRRLVGFFVARGLPVVYHSDGDIRKVIPLLIEAGVRCLQPLEAKANMDLLELKREYGHRLVFMGNVDFDRIARGQAEAESEIRTKVGLGKLGGGYIYHSDHSIPPNISLSYYQRILEMVRSYGRYEPRR